MEVKPCPGCGKFIPQHMSSCSEECERYMEEIADVFMDPKRLDEEYLWTFITNLMPGVYKEACGYGADAKEADPTWHCCDWREVVRQYERMKEVREERWKRKINR